MIGLLFSFFATRTGGIVAGVAFVVLALLANNVHQRSIGAAKVVAKIEKATNHAINTAASAGAKSASGGGVLELPYRD